MSSWTVRQLTTGTPQGRFHSHSYYDVPVFDESGRNVCGHCVNFEGRHPNPDDEIRIGIVDTEAPAGDWVEVGTSKAWSWQQGALSQWVPGPGRRLIWNDRDGRQFVARVLELDGGEFRTLPRSIYALAPDGRMGLSLDMARLHLVRPGYGYVGGKSEIGARAPADEGIWSVDLQSGQDRLILSLERAKKFLLSRLPLRERAKHVIRRYDYWFNHAKISPDGKRFTVKLRFRQRDRSRGWNDRMGVSLTCGMDGEDLRLLAPATSHVIWLSREKLMLWQDGYGVRVFEDAAPGGKPLRSIAPEHTRNNVHIRQMPGEEGLFIFDTPYQEEIDLLLWNAADHSLARAGRFTGHVPKRGPFRCDLHPVPSADGRKVVATSLQDGGRQIYLLERHR